MEQEDKQMHYGGKAFKLIETPWASIVSILPNMAGFRNCCPAKKQSRAANLMDDGGAEIIPSNNMPESRLSANNHFPAVVSIP
jgi:hypothetical protein